MPGQLTRNAKCPLCNLQICALVDYTSRLSVRRNYYHEKPATGRRKYPCGQVFTNMEQARRDRRNLEVPMRKGKVTKQYERWIERLDSK